MAGGHAHPRGPVDEQQVQVLRGQLLQGSGDRGVCCQSVAQLTRTWGRIALLFITFYKPILKFKPIYYSSLTGILLFKLPPYYSGRVWEGIWNQTHLLVLNCCLENLHRFTISHDKTRWNRWYQWPELLKTYRTVNFCNWHSGLEKSCYIDIGLS